MDMTTTDQFDEYDWLWVPEPDWTEQQELNWFLYQLDMLNDNERIIANYRSVDAQGS